MLSDVFSEVVGMQPWLLLTELLDGMFSVCQKAGFSAAQADSLVHDLRDLRIATPERDWRQLVELASGHPIHALFRECPVVDHSVRRPRGYPGDADLIDHFYEGIRPEYVFPVDALIFGKEMFHWIVRHPSSESLRQRRDFMTQEIAALLERQRGAKVLSVAAGHAREWLPLNEHIHAGHVLLTALDQDEQSLEVIRRTLEAESIRTVNDSIVNLLSGNSLAGTFDLIYSMGLYDYLTDGVAERLTDFLYSKLEPGGRLLIANYTPEMELTSFIEMFMQWDLIYRDLRQMRQLARRIPLADPSLLAVKQLAGRMILVLELTRPS